MRSRDIKGYFTYALLSQKSRMIPDVKRQRTPGIPVAFNPATYDGMLTAGNTSGGLVCIIAAIPVRLVADLSEDARVT